MTKAKVDLTKTWRWYTYVQNHKAEWNWEVLDSEVHCVCDNCARTFKFTYYNM